MKQEIQFSGLEIPSEFTIAVARLQPSMAIRTQQKPGTSLKTSKTTSKTNETKPKISNFSANLTIQGSTVDPASGALPGRPVAEVPESEDPNEVIDIVCSEKMDNCPSGGSSSILDSLLGNFQDDLLFNSDTDSDSAAIESDVFCGKKAKKKLKVKF